MKYLFFLKAGNYITCHIEIARELGSHTAAILLSELCEKYSYHLEKDEIISDERFGDDLFYYTIELCEERTALSKDEQKTAIEVLEKKGLIKKFLKGAPPKRYFKLLHENIEKFISDLQLKFSNLRETRNSKNSEKKPISPRENLSTDASKSKSGKLAFRKEENPQILHIIDEYKDEHKTTTPPAASESESSKDILVYQDKSGNFLEVTISQICRRFAFQNYSIQEIKEAMQVVRDNGEKLDDVYAYITGIIANLRNKSREVVYNKQVKNVKCSDDDYTIPISLYKELANQLLDGVKTSEQAELIVQPEHKQKWKEIYEEVKAKRLQTN